MKRIAAVLLCGAICMSLVSCSKAEETKKKKKKTKKTTVETEETEETDIPTDETTDTSATEDTSDTEPSESETTPPENIFVMDDSLSMLDLSYPYELWRYTAAFDKESEQTNSLFLAVDQLYFEPGSPYTQLESALERDLADSSGATIAQYKEDSQKFLSDAKSGGAPAGKNYEFRTALFRSDTQIFSFAITSSVDMEEGEFRAYNYRTEDGSTITLDDVVLDRAALSGYVEQLLNMPGAGNDYKTWLSDVENSILDGSFVFTMTYDAINILITNYGMINYDVIKIPVYGHEDIFNMEYFGKTPQYYTIFDDINHEILWDVNSDGQMDTIKVSSEYSEGTSDYGSDEVILNVDYNGYKIDSKTLGLDIFAYDVLYSMVMKTDSGFYLYCRMNSIDSFEDTYVFKIDKDTLSYVGYFGDFMCARGLIDPQNFEMRDICDTLGSCFYSNVFSVIGNNGMPEFLYDLWVSDADPITTKIDISCAKVDENNYTKVEDTTIPAGSFVRPYLYDVQTRRLIVMVVNEDPAKEFYAELDFEKDDNFNFTVNGKDIYDVFYSIMFWG